MNGFVGNIRVAEPSEASTVVDIVNEAATWLERRGIPLWSSAELDVAPIVADVNAGYYVLAFNGRDAVGTMRLTLEDELFWPEALSGEAVYVHRLALRRSQAGTQVPRAMLEWAAGRARDLQCTWVRLDCEAKRPKLRALYEGLGFQFHSEHHVNDLFVARYQLRAK